MMLALGLQGSPNAQGSTAWILSRLMAGLAANGVQTRTVDVAKKNIHPCKGCGYCEKKGVCVIRDDDMAGEIYPLLRESEIIIAASPVFFYSVPSQLKALIDRTQTLWSRKYRFQLADPLKKTRRGCLLSHGGTRGKLLFDGIALTTKYFFDAVDSDFSGSLTYRNIETRKDILQHATVESDITDMVGKLLSPLRHRKKVLFAGKGDACRSPMAGAFARYLGGDKLDVTTAGMQPRKQVDPDMVRVMAEKGMDVAFYSPTSATQAMTAHAPDFVVTMDADSSNPLFPEAKTIAWHLPDSRDMAGESIETLRDRIEKAVKNLLKSKELFSNDGTQA